MVTINRAENYKNSHATLFIKQLDNAPDNFCVTSDGLRAIIPYFYTCLGSFHIIFNDNGPVNIS